MGIPVSSKDSIWTLLRVRGKCWTWEHQLQTLFFSDTWSNPQWFHFPGAFHDGLARLEAIADGSVNNPVSFDLFHPQFFSVLSDESIFFFFPSFLVFQHLNKSQFLIANGHETDLPGKRNLIFMIVSINMSLRDKDSDWWTNVHFTDVYIGDIFGIF